MYWTCFLFFSLSRALFCGCSLFLYASLCVQHRTGDSLQPVWKPVERVIEGMDVPALRKQVLIRWNKVLTSDNRICGNTSPNLVLHLQESMKNLVLLYTIQASLSNSDNSHVFNKVPMFNSSMLSSDVINCLSLIYRAMIFLWHWHFPFKHISSSFVSNDSCSFYMPFSV